MPQLANALRRKLRGQHDSEFATGSEWQRFKQRRVLPLITLGSGQCNARRAAAHALSTSLVQHIARGTLSEGTVALGARIAAGALDDLPVVEGIVLSALQRAERGARGLSMRSREKELDDAQFERVLEAATALANPRELRHLLGLPGGRTRAFRAAEGAGCHAPRSSYCSLSRGILPDVVAEVSARLSSTSTEARVPVCLVGSLAIKTC